MSQDLAWQKLKKEVIDQGLCTRCGSCVGLCQSGAIRFRDQLGSCLPKKIKPCSCEGCQKTSWLACSGKYVPFPKIEKMVFGQSSKNRFLGQILSTSVGYSLDPTIRRLSASGGLITTTLLYLLKTKQIKAAVVVGNHPNQPYRPQVKLARTPKQIMKAAQSKYAIVPINTILKKLQSFKGKIAYVGLPCQVHSLRKLQLVKHPTVKNIAYVLGSYCGINLHFTAVKSFLKNQGINDLKKVKSLQFRAGEWPGKMRVETHDGRIVELEKFYANYLIPFYAMKRCLVCADLANEFADISFGDAWAPRYEERKQGWSLVLTRTQKGSQLIKEMLKQRVIHLESVSLKEVINMHSHMLDFKKRGTFIRISRKPISQQPDYGYYPTNIPFKRQLFEYVISGLFWFGQTKVAHFIIEHLPLPISGKLFMQVRLIWKRLTYLTKRSGLSNLKFKINK